MSEPKQPNLQSHFANTIQFKYLVGLLWICFAAWSFGRRPLGWGSLVLLPFVLISIFHLSLAVVQVRDGMLRYRRFLKWTGIQKEEVVSSGAFFMFGYMRLNHYVFPWGKIYFVLDRNVNPNPFQKPDFPLLRYLKGESALEQPSQVSAVKDRFRELKLLALGLAGALYSWIASAYLQIANSRSGFRSVMDQSSTPKGPAWIVAPQRFYSLLNDFPVIPVLLVIFILLTAYKRRQPVGWLYAFLAGSSLGRVLFLLFSG